jgi:hypothetical protein
MLIPFKIYIRAVGLYALITLPALIVPVIYLLSIMYVLLYGWFAWGLYTIIYLIVTKSNIAYESKIFLLGMGVIPSVLFAFQMLEVLNVEDNIWNSGGFLLFPVAAIVAGWISLSFSKKEVGRTCPEYIKEMMDDMKIG